jgi:hypothetical protein
MAVQSRRRYMIVIEQRPTLQLPHRRRRNHLHGISTSTSTIMQILHPQVPPNTLHGIVL